MSQVQPLRRSWLLAANTIAEDYAKGGFLDSQTTDTQVFGFEKSSGAPVFRDDRSEDDNDYQDEEDGSQAVNNDDDIEESQLPGYYGDEDYNDTQFADADQSLEQQQVNDSLKLRINYGHLSRPLDQQHSSNNNVASFPDLTPVAPATAKSEPRPTQLDRPVKRSTPDDGFEPAKEPDHKKVSLKTVSEPSSPRSRASKPRQIVDNVLAAKYKDRNLIWELIEEGEREAGRKPNWSVLNLIDNKEHDGIISRMCRDLGIPTDREFQHASVLRKAHLVATSALFRLSCRPLLLEAGVTDDLDILKDSVANGRVLLAATERLICIEENARAFSEQR
ncbi:hypothetical protein V5O48_009278 [Marasmius crinis-equi]|uniref:Calponin-homology (CH) domain-containing protein n=1 Tax=Marasmius crinis-equi TaxID=585013 RepID=A0ABR3FBQ9_9AGAR